LVGLRGAERATRRASSDIVRGTPVSIVIAHGHIPCALNQRSTAAGPPSDRV
jgi:hypothetical protein